MKTFSIRSRLVFAAAITSLGALGAVACGTEGAPGGSESPENTGSVGLDLDLGPDVTVNSVSYEIVGNGFTKTGSINVSRSRTLRATIPCGSFF